MNKIARLCILLLLLLLICGTSCKNKKSDEKYAKGNWFSIYQYALDSWKGLKGTQFPVMKTIRINGGKTDTTYAKSDTLNWAPILLTFFATDISAKRYLDQYSYNYFKDDQDNTINLYYKAKDPDLYTQKLLVTLDANDGKVNGVYIETYEKTAIDEVTKKLYYSPSKTIQIQTDDIPVFGKRRHTVQEWDFLL